ncbi:MAG: hypothetical protein KDB07_01105 [Planctomycetes bacterium]|nr:hypothetical protein [Planctomycetota bacterium]
MSNAVVAAAAAGVISFAAAMAGTFLLIDSDKTPVPQQNNEEALVARIAKLEAELEAKNEASASSKRASRNANAGPNVDSKISDLKSELDKRFATLEGKIGKNAAMAAPSGENVEMPSDQAEVLKIVETNLDEMMDRRDERRREERRIESIASFKDSAPKRLETILNGKLVEYGLSDVQVQTVKNAYAARVDAMLNVVDDIRLARESGITLTEDEQKAKFAQAVASHNETIKATLGNDAYSKVIMDISRADFESSRENRGTGIDMSALQAVNPEATARFREGMGNRFTRDAGGNNGGQGGQDNPRRNNNNRGMRRGGDNGGNG